MAEAIELADIIAPLAPPPAPLPYMWIALGVALVLLLLFFALHRWLKRTRSQRWASAALKRTERDLQSGKLDARAAVFQIARAAHMSAPQQQHEAAWATLAQALDHARFSPQPIDALQAVQLLAQVRQWIGRHT